MVHTISTEGHTATIVTHEEYKDWVVGFGINHCTAGGDPAVPMKLSIEHSVSFLCILLQCPTKCMLIQIFLPQFFKESIGKVHSSNYFSHVQCRQDNDLHMEPTYSAQF